MDNTPPLPKGPVIAIVLMAVSLFAFVMIVTNLLGYQANLSQAKEKYEQGSYVEAVSCRGFRLRSAMKSFIISWQLLLLSRKSIRHISYLIITVQKLMHLMHWYVHMGVMT